MNAWQLLRSLLPTILLVTSNWHQGIAPIIQLQKAGVAVGIATDSVASNNNLDMFEEGRTAALLQKMKSGDASQFPIETALKALTIEGAKVLGMENQIGSLEVGKQADFLVIQPQGKIHLQPQEKCFLSPDLCCQIQ